MASIFEGVDKETMKLNAKNFHSFTLHRAKLLPSAVLIASFVDYELTVSFTIADMAVTNLPGKKPIAPCVRSCRTHGKPRVLGRVWCAR